MAFCGARRSVLAGAWLLALAACGSSDELAAGTCIVPEDCQGQPAFGTVCYLGVCVECAAEQDCTAGLTCVQNKCVSP